VTIIAASFHHSGRTTLKDANTAQVAEYGGVRYVLLPASPYEGNGPGRIRNMFQFTWKALRKSPSLAGDKPDVVIGSSVHPFAAWAGQRLARRYRVPFVFEVRDLWPQSLIDMGALGSHHPLAVALRGLEGFLYRRAAVTITPLPYAYEYIGQFGVPEDRVLYLPNGVDLSNFPTREAHTDPNPFTLMYFGAHGIVNGLSTLLDAAAELEREPASRPVSWRFVGNGAEKPVLMHHASELRLHSVRFEDWVPRECIPVLAAEADGLVFHLKALAVFDYGISPNKLFDYLAARRPVIFGCEARNNLVVEAKAGFTVPPEDPKALAGAVRGLVELPPDERAEMGLRGRRYVETHHSYERLGERLEGALRVLVGADNVPRENDPKVYRGAKGNVR
jgi:glycosyltransferase involved in cell wall biosynthesis